MADNICTVCLEKVSVNGENIIKLECNHSFHRDCVMFLKNTLCPNCRLDSTILVENVTNPIEKLNELAAIMLEEYNNYVSSNSVNYSEQINKLNRLCGEKLYPINLMFDKKHSAFIEEIQSHFSMLLELLNICGSSDEDNFGDLEILFDIIKSMSQKIELNYVQIKFGDVSINSDSGSDEEPDDGSDD